MNFMSNWIKQASGNQVEEEEQVARPHMFFVRQGAGSWLDRTQRPDDRRPIPVMPTAPGGPTRPLPVMPRPPGSPARPLPVMPQPPGNPMAGVVGGDNEMLMRLMAMFGRR